MIVASGVHDTVLVIGVEKMRDKSTAEGLLSRAAAGHPLYNRGETAPVLFAPFATRHMYEHGTTPEMLAAVAVKNHHNGCLDPYAHFQNEITIDQVLSSPPVCQPVQAARLLPADRRRCGGHPHHAGTRQGSHRQAGLRVGLRACDRPPVAPREVHLHGAHRHHQGGEARVRDGGPHAGRHGHGGSSRLLHDHGNPRHRGHRFLREGQGRAGDCRGCDCSRRADPREPVRADCSPRATRSGPPGSHRSASATGSFARRPAHGRWRSATGTRCSTTPAAGARGSRSSTS